jgi:hypothetical protein
VHRFGGRLELCQGSFFDTDWTATLESLPEPLLILGNPPWVTNSALGAAGAANLPRKRAQPGSKGLSAKTGKSNFDVTEWLITRLCEAAAGRRAAIAMLCKTSVARRVLLRAWRDGPVPASASLFEIDAQQSFGASCDACLLLIRYDGARGRKRASIYDSLKAARPRRMMALRDDRLVADLDAHRRWGHLLAGPGGEPRWRSGVKHDCASVMELRRDGDRLRNRLGEEPALEPDYLYPLLKSSEVQRGASPTRVVLLTQRRPGEPTASIAARAPRTWRYLQRHGDRLDGRGSSIYRNRPRFSIFGVGPYTFAPWKVAISGFYKSLRFSMVGRHQGKPVVFDDTCYFAACGNRAEARQLLALLETPAAQELLAAYIFWDAKRPITAELLNRLDLDQLAREAGGADKRALSR